MPEKGERVFSSAYRSMNTGATIQLQFSYEFNLVSSPTKYQHHKFWNATDTFWKTEYFQK